MALSPAEVGQRQTPGVGRRQTPGEGQNLEVGLGHSGKKIQQLDLKIKKIFIKINLKNTVIFLKSLS